MELRSEGGWDEGKEVIGFVSYYLVVLWDRFVGSVMGGEEVMD